MGGVKRLVIIVAVAALPLAALAQTQGLRDRDPDLDGAKKIAGELQEANIHSGPFYMLSKIQISDVGFSQDYYLPTGDLGGGFNLRVEAPQRLYVVPHRKTVFSAELVPAYSFFDVGDSKGQFDYRVRGDAHFLFNHLYLDVYALRDDQLRAQIADVNRLATERNNEVGVAGEVKFSSKTSTLFSVRHREAEFPNSRYQPRDELDQIIPLNILDRSERNARVSFHHKTFPLTSLFVAGEASEYEFDRATYKDSTRRYVGAGFLRQAGRTTLRGEAGRTRLQFDDPSRRDFAGVTADLTLNRTRGRWSYGFGGRRDLGFAIFLDNDYYIAHVGRADISYSATRRLTLRGGSTLERDLYDTPVLGIKRRDTYSFTYVGFSYGLRRLRTGIDAGWFNRDSNFVEEDSGIRWVLHLSFTP